MPQTTESSDEEWEEVGENETIQDEDVKTSENVEVELAAPKAVQKKLKKLEMEKEMIQLSIRRAIKRFDKESQLDTHKVHLLCLLTLGMRLNRICNTDEIKALVYSILPQRYTNCKPKDVSAIFLTRFIQEFSKLFEFENGVEKLQNCGYIRVPKLENLLPNIIEKRKVQFRMDLVLLFISALRMMGFNTRLVLSLQPISLKPLTEKQKAMENASKNTHNSKKKGSPQKRKSDEDVTIPQVDGPSDSPPKRATRSRTKQSNEMKENIKSTKNTKGRKNTKNQKEKLADTKPDVGRKISTRKSALLKEAKVVLKKEDVNSQKLKKKSPAKKSSPVKKELPQKMKDETPLMKPLSQSKAKRSLSRKTAKRKINPPASKDDDSDVDCDFEPVELSESRDESEDSDFEVSAPKKKKTHVKKSTNNPATSKSRKSANLSIPGKKKAKQVSPRRNSGVKKLDSQDYYDQWLEVFSEQEKKWICLDVFRCVVNHPEKIEKYATPPMHYVLGFDNDDNIKDITARYASKWLTDTRKLRVGIADKDWWKTTLSPYMTSDTAGDLEENKQMQEHLLAQPIPTSICSFKNHPLFALRRHILKYEAIYPEDVSAIGIVKGEEVFPRSAVHTLHTRDKWMQEARVVREGEKPYKMVASIWINMKLKQDMSTLSMPLFGIWQTEPFVPPVAKDGKVPRNQYGNVDLFKPEMMPIGCVQLRLQGLQKVAHKLNIDIATAITGFDTHHGYPHPVTDGYIVCQEFEETLVAAWNENQAHVAEREKKKREERVYGRWKLFIKAMLAKERIKRKYAVMEKVAGEKGKGTPISAESGSVWQAKRLQEAKSKSKGRGRKAKKGENDNLFPFEMESN